MNSDDFFTLGYISKKRGYRGDVIINLDVDDPQKYRKIKTIYIKNDGIFVPYILSSLKLFKENKIIVHIDTIDSEQTATYFLQKKIYLPIKLLPKLDGKKFYFHEIIDFIAIDKNFGKIGMINSVINENIQPLFVIKSKKKEILIPINDNIIKSIDRIKKIIYLECPNGLIELYI